jgi:predicted protein tyrosine phosphatase
MKLLFICGKNRLRSPTAEAIFSAYPGIEAESAGVDRDAEVMVGADAIDWADLILVMENTHRRKLAAKFQHCLRNKRVVCLDIPDNYEYMEPELVDILEHKMQSILPAIAVDMGKYQVE